MAKVPNDGGQRGAAALCGDSAAPAGSASGLREALDDLGVTPAEARAGVERSRANKLDAERYRWLRTNALDCQETEGLEIVRLIPAHRSPNHADIDTAIDAAMEATSNDKCA